jgi:hypothetical protein
MENLIGWLLMVMLVAVPVLLVWAGVKLYKRTKLKQAQEEQEQIELAKKAKEDWKKRYDGATHVGKTTYDYTLDKSRTTVTERDTGRRMSYVHENDSGPDLLTTAIIANMLFNNKDSSAGTVKWDNDVPSVTETKSSSWGLDDDDSRKSASSSFSSSDSSSSWDSSSSSDSGPSSDW